MEATCFLVCVWHTNLRNSSLRLYLQGKKIWKGHMPSSLHQDTFIQYMFTRQKTVDVLITIIV